MKIVNRNVAVALGIALIVLIAGMGRAIANCTMQARDQNDTADLFNAEIPKLIDEWNQLLACGYSRMNHSLLPSLIDIGTLFSQGETPAMAQGSAYGFQVTATLGKTVYRLGETIDVTVTITNLSNETENIGFSGEWGGGPNGWGYNGWNFNVYDSMNNTAYSSGWPDPDSTGSRNYLPPSLPLEWSDTMNPGDSESCELSWQQYGWSAYVSAGIYYVVGEFDGLGWTIITTPIQITILPF